MFRRITDTLVFLFVLALFLFIPGKSHIEDHAKNPAPYTGLPDSLPHYMHKQAEDSLRRIENVKDFWLKHWGSGWSFFSIGFLRVAPDISDRHGIKDSSLKNPGGSFFSIGGYRLDHHTKFLWQKDHPVLQYTVWTDKEGNAWSRHFAKREVAVRFQPEEGNNALGKVLVPIRKNAFLVEAILIMLNVLSVLFMMYALVIRPVYLLRSLSRGKFFDPRHARDLRRFGWTLVAIAFLPLLLNFIFGLIFRHIIPDELRFPAFQVVAENNHLIAGGLAVLLLARAFKRGYELQVDKDSIV